jgi:hypothetical protein
VEIRRAPRIEDDRGLDVLPPQVDVVAAELRE